MQCTSCKALCVLFTSVCVCVCARARACVCVCVCVCAGVVGWRWLVVLLTSIVGFLVAVCCSNENAVWVGGNVLSCPAFKHCLGLSTVVMKQSNLIVLSWHRGATLFILLLAVCLILKTKLFHFIVVSFQQLITLTD